MEVLLWALRFILGAMIAFPFAGGLGFTLIDHYFKRKRELHADILKSQLAALQSREQPPSDG